MRSEMTEMFATEDRLSQAPRMVIMVGLSRTGKSTFVNQFVRDAARLGKAFVIVAGDDVRRAMGVRYDSRVEDQVKAYMLMLANTVMQRRQHVIIDETNLTEVERKRWVDLAEASQYHWVIAEIEPLDEATHKRECKKHDYPWDVIEIQRKRYQPVTGAQALKYNLVKKEER